MNCKRIKEEITKHLPALFECKEGKEYLKILTPFFYPDGDYVEIFLKDKQRIYLTDLGETLRFLGDHDIDLKRSPKRRKVVDDILLTHGVRLFRGRLMVELEDFSKFPHALIRLGQAIVQVSDLIFTLKTGVATSFKDEVEELFIEKNIPYDLDYQVIGKSGETYKIDFYIEAPKKPKLVETLSSASTSYANMLVSKTIRIWHDIAMVNGRYHHFSFIDDSVDIWKPEWINQLATLSEIISWSEREDMIAKIVGG